MRRTSKGTIAWVSAICIAIAMCTTARVSAQEDEAAARAQVLALEKAWNQAYKAGDTKALAAILSSEGRATGVAPLFGPR